MLEFTNAPPKDPRGESLPIVRTPANRALNAIIISPDLLGTRTHFYHGRTLPCDSQNCPACIDGFPWRWHAYLGIWSSSTHRTALLEMTARAVEPIIQYRESHKTLIGCEISCRRATTSPNSRVIVTTRPADLQGIKLPPPPDVMSALSILWNLPQSSLQIQGAARNAPALYFEDDPSNDSSIANRDAATTQKRNGELTRKART